MYLDSLVRIKNSLTRGRDKVKLPYSKLDFAILESLTKEGYLESIVKKGRSVRRVIDIKLKYQADGKPAISGIKFISRPSRRLYTGYRNLKRSRQGYGHYIISTPRGILTDAEARQKKIGGQILFEIW